MQLTILVLNDIHLDLNFDNDNRACKNKSTQFKQFGVVNCDTTVPLYEQLQSQINRQFPCIYLGDSPAHGQNTNFDLIKKVMTDVNCSGYALGNNDAETNYKFDNKRINQFMQMDNNFQEDGLYINYNFYDGIVYIGLNTVNLQKIDQYDQLGRLEAVLKNATQFKQQVVIGCHIPFGAGHFKGDFIDSKIRQNYKQILAKYENQIILEVNGHYHTEWWRWIGNIPSFINPGISPSNQNFPGYREYKLEKVENKWHLVDYHQYYADLTKEEVQFEIQYKFSQLYPLLQDQKYITGEVLKQLSAMQYFDKQFLSWRTIQRNMLEAYDINQIIKNMKD
ncbi:Acid sphingomyelinase-like phosphodiesterase 3b [Spironucleus salmonicida]|uniref:Acid sphingomyelinase-like phosphodiesterase 3b n=1 Tax=Spironucleus salmonicida TaxID=348837 RepID=V6M528_9EUKA|nr:Acid sphingomyelinase-like phosphodiesterase 3b [Spironucleus salmonicida]|eukprot:EST48464.1 Acid sphingomyelinase-like phosphodiesterase 3b precursor [Spironucleus salmonicida]